MRAIQENLSRVAREIENAEDKVEKYKKKGSSKIAGAHQNVNNALAEWDSQAPLVFEKLQVIDEARLLMLTDVLTRYETYEVDKAQQVVSLCEANLNALLSFDSQDEIKLYALQIQTNGVPRTARISSRHAAPPPPPMHQTLSPASTVQSPVAVASPTSKRRSSVATADTNMSSPNSSRSRFSRMSTMLRPGGKGENGRRGLFGLRDKDRNKYSEQIDVSPVREPSQVSAETESIDSNRSRLSRPEPPPHRTTSGAVPVVLQAPGPGETLNQPGIVTNGNAYVQDPDAIDVIGTYHPAVPPPLQAMQPVPVSQFPPQQPQVDSEGYSIPPPVSKEETGPVSLEDEEDLTAHQDQQPGIKVDIQSQTIKDEHEDAQAAVERVAASLRSRPTISGRSVRGRRGEIQSKSTGPELNSSQVAHGIPPPLPPHRGEHAAVVPAVEFIEEQPSTLPAGTVPPVETVSEPEVGLEKIVGQTNEIGEGEPIAEKEGGVEAAGPQSDESIPKTEPAVAQAPPVLPPLSTDTTSVTEKASEVVAAVPSEQYYTPIITSQPQVPTVQRIESMTSSVTSPTWSTTAAEEHPQESIVPGLSSSVVETVHVSLQNGAPIRTLIVGEIALAFASSTSPSPMPVPVRLTNTSGLDRVLPNKSLLVPSESGVEGEYTLDAGTLSSAPAIAFKYSNTSFAYAPIIVDPIWKFEPRQTSVMVYYYLNPDFVVDELTVSDLSIEVGIEGAVATACRSKPSGVFDQEHGRLSIPIAGDGQEVRLRKTDEKVQVLVRFLNEGLARESSSGGVVVKFRYSPPAAMEGVCVEVLDVAKKSAEPDDPFADEAGAEGEWSLVPVVRSVVAGRYFAASSSASD
ncbi:Muniscin C-terminal mu homology domain-containing protein [Lipomyces kononenkoae]|uniref:Muniscin C-terminal mu homology domain-containing protein n=1 Tax=Lipomyces kononenkoae TaxID=34357 RepID=A0ACC3SVL8_LIPKO